jgi:hypothetical protein
LPDQMSMGMPSPIWRSTRFVVLALSACTSNAPKHLRPEV